MFQLHHVVLVILTLHGVMAVCTKKTTIATGTSAKPTVASTAVTHTTGKHTTAVITATSATSKSTTSTAASSGRRKRDVDKEKPIETDEADPASSVENCDDNSSVAVVHGYTTIVIAFAAFFIIYKKRI